MIIHLVLPDIGWLLYSILDAVESLKLTKVWHFVFDIPWLRLIGHPQVLSFVFRVRLLGQVDRGIWPALLEGMGTCKARCTILHVHRPVHVCELVAVELLETKAPSLTVLIKLLSVKSRQRGINRRELRVDDDFSIIYGRLVLDCTILFHLLR